MWKRIKKTFYHHLIKKNIRPSDVFFPMIQYLAPCLTNYFQPFPSNPLRILSKKVKLLIVRGVYMYGGELICHFRELASPS